MYFPGLELFLLFWDQSGLCSNTCCCLGMKPSCWESMAVPSQCDKRQKTHQRQYNEKKSWDYHHDDNAYTNIASWDNLSNNRLNISRKPELTICSGWQGSIDHHQKPGKTLNELSQAFRFVFSSTWLQGTECRPFLSPRRQSKQSKCHLPLSPDVLGDGLQICWYITLKSINYTFCQ